MSSNDPHFLAALQNIAATRKSSFLWTRDTPYAQPYFTFFADRNIWLPSTDASTLSPPRPTVLDRFILITWNIDFMLPLTSARLASALSHLENLLFPSPSAPPPKPVVIFLQEMLVSDLRLIQSTPWVRDHFHLTDVDSTFWESGYYGTCTLIDRRLPIKDVFRVHYTLTRMERDGLFVDIVAEKDQVLRFCNTHLESLVADPPLRPAQMTVAAQFMRTPAVHAGFLAGDLNAIQPFDRTLHSGNDLKDAYLELGGTEDSDDGYTWGQQARTELRVMYGCSRMDKIFYCGKVNVTKLERIGIDVEVKSEDDKQLLKQEGQEKGWVTDHLGLIAEFAVSGADDKGELGNNGARV